MSLKVQHWNSPSRYLIGLLTIIGIVVVLLVEDKTAGNIFFFVITIELWLFTLVYGWKARWRNSAPTRALFYLLIAFSGVALQGSANLVFGSNYHGRENIRQVMYLVIALTLLNIIYTLYRSIKLVQKMNLPAYLSKEDLERS